MTLFESRLNGITEKTSSKHEQRVEWLRKPPPNMSRGLNDCENLFQTWAEGWVVCSKPPPNISSWLGILCWPPSFNKQRANMSLNDFRVVADLLHKEIKDQILKKIYIVNQPIHKAKGVIKTVFQFQSKCPHQMKDRFFRRHMTVIKHRPPS